MVNKLRGGLKVAAVKAPGFGDRRKAMLEDIAILTNGEMISEDLGIKLENVTLGMLGQAKRVTIAKDDTTSSTAPVTRLRSKARVDQIRGRSRHHLRPRQGEAEGAPGQARRRRRRHQGRRGHRNRSQGTKDRVDDALHATRAAVEEGIVPGGGVALLYATKVFEGLTGENEDQTRGIDIVRKALAAEAAPCSAASNHRARRRGPCTACAPTIAPATNPPSDSTPVTRPRLTPPTAVEMMMATAIQSTRLTAQVCRPDALTLQPRTRGYNQPALGA